MEVKERMVERRKRKAIKGEEGDGSDEENIRRIGGGNSTKREGNGSDREHWKRGRNSTRGRREEVGGENSMRGVAIKGAGSEEVVSSKQPSVLGSSGTWVLGPPGPRVPGPRVPGRRVPGRRVPGPRVPGPWVPGPRVSRSSVYSLPKFGEAPLVLFPGLTLFIASSVTFCIAA